jgi:peroxiredoxin
VAAAGPPSDRAPSEPNRVNAMNNSERLSRSTGTFRSWSICAVAAWAALLFLVPTARAAEGNAQGNAPDFPPGTFSDGGHYSLSDFKGKLVVLFFYEKDCPRCRGEIPERNKVVDQFQDKPVVFIAVGPNDTLADVRGYINGTHLKLTTFADTLGVMEGRYGFHISLQNIYQFRYIGPDGNLIMDYSILSPEVVERALAKVKWKYRDSGYDPKLNNAIMLLEYNQYKQGLQALKPYLKGKTPAAASAQKLYDAVKEEGKQWLEEADAAKETDPAKAYDLYAKVSAAFVGDDLAKTADDNLKKLKTDKAVQDELAARQMYDALYNVMGRATARNRAELIAYCNGISNKYPKSATGQKAAQLAKDLEKAGTLSGK